MVKLKFYMTLKIIYSNYYHVFLQTTFLYAPCRNDESSCDDGMHSNTIGVGGVINDNPENPTTSSFSPVDDIQPTTSTI